MKVLILTSSDSGTAAHHLPFLLNSPSCDVAMVIVNGNQLMNKKKFYKRKLKKMFQIGLLGALNGIRMRKWFNEDVGQYAEMVSLKLQCEKHHIPYYETPMINCSITEALFIKAKADIGLSLGNGYIGEKIFTIPVHGMLNIHHEILPQYKNAQSIIWQLYNGSSNTGYTIHKIDKGIDTGEIIYQQPVPIGFRDTLSDTIAYTSALLLKASATGLVYVLEHFDELIKKSILQTGGASYTTPGIRQYFQIRSNYQRLKKETEKKQ